MCFFSHMISWYHDIIVIYPLFWQALLQRDREKSNHFMKHSRSSNDVRIAILHPGISTTHIWSTWVCSKCQMTAPPKVAETYPNDFVGNLKGFSPMYVYIIHAYIHMCLQTYMYIYIIPDLVRERHRIKINGYKWQIEFLFISIYFFLWSLSHHCGGADSPRKQLLHFQVLIHSNNIFMNAWHFKHLKFKSWFNKNTKACKTRIRFSLFRHCKQIWRPSAGWNGTKNYRTNKSQIGLS